MTAPPAGAVSFSGIAPQAMKYSLAVYGAPFSSQSAYSAYRFARTALALGHQIERVFFYQDGVHNATLLATPPQDELDLCQAWRQLKREHNLDLVVCVAAALRRGILNAAEASRHERPCANLPEEFELSGLGQLVEAVSLSDRFVTFGS